MKFIIDLLELILQKLKSSSTIQPVMKSTENANSQQLRLKAWLTYDEVMETGKWAKLAPSLRFPSSWLVTFLPPSSGCTMRFIVEDYETKSRVSVKLFCYDELVEIEQPDFNCPQWHIFSLGDNEEKEESVCEFSQDGGELIEKIKEQLLV